VHVTEASGSSIPAGTFDVLAVFSLLSMLMTALIVAVFKLGIYSWVVAWYKKVTHISGHTST
jgi:hypothetical protein